MIEVGEYCRGSEILQKVPKLFKQSCHDKAVYAKYLLESSEGKNANQKINGVKKDHHCISEIFFCYLKSGLEIDLKAYGERYKEIETSTLYAVILKQPLLKIFTYLDFVIESEKTPELYFNVYKSIINSHKDNSEVFTSLLSCARLEAQHSAKIEKIMSSENVEQNDLIHLYLNSNEDKFFEVMYALTSKDNPLLDWLFQSDLNSHFVDYLLECKNIQTFKFIDRIIKSQKVLAKAYIRNWKFQNGVNVLAWFKAYMYYEKGLLPKTYIMEGSLKKYISYCKEFISYDIFASEIVAMFPNSTKSHAIVNLSEEERSIVNGIETDILSDKGRTPKRKSRNPKTDTSPQSKFRSLEDKSLDHLVKTTMFFDPKKSTQFFVPPSLQRHKIILKTKSFDSKTDIDSKTETLENEFKPISGVCFNLMETKIEKAPLLKPNERRFFKDMDAKINPYDNLLKLRKEEDPLCKAILKLF